MWMSESCPEPLVGVHVIAAVVESADIGVHGGGVLDVVLGEVLYAVTERTEGSCEISVLLCVIGTVVCDGRTFEWPLLADV